MIKSICVFCGARDGVNPVYKEQAYELGKILAENQIRLIYGGASIGVMGAVAQGCLDNGGTVEGIIPQSILELEVASDKLSELHIVNSMHERKQKMHDLSDAFICLAGGMGTLDEFFETSTWKQLGYHKKTIGFLNTNNFYDPMFANLRHLETEGFVYPKDVDSLILESDPKKLINQLSELS